jgi:hypothetical protein
LIRRTISGRATHALFGAPSHTSTPPLAPANFKSDFHRGNPIQSETQISSPTKNHPRPKIPVNAYPSIT